MIPAGLGPQRIDGTASGYIIEKDAVAISHSGKGKGFGFRMKMLDQMLLHQPSCYLLEVPLQLKLVHQLHTYQVRRLHLDRQTAAGSGAVVAESLVVFSPGCNIVDICLDDR
jgi:hypothetical protein